MCHFVRNAPGSSDLARCRRPRLCELRDTWHRAGYLIARLNPDVKLNNGSRSVAERILIAFHPGERRFEVSDPAVGRRWAGGPNDAAPSGEQNGMA